MLCTDYTFYYRKTQHDEGARTQAMLTAGAASRVCFEILKNENLKYLDTVVHCIKLIANLLPVFQECDENTEQSKKRNLSVSRKIFTDLLNSIKSALRKHFSREMPCYTLELVDQELQVILHLCNCNINPIPKVNEMGGGGGF